MVDRRESNRASAEDAAYSGYCERCKTVHRLPRSPEAERAAQALMCELKTSPEQSKGKMYGVLLTRDAQGRRVTLRAYSGRLERGHEGAGWVPPVPETDTSAEEAHTFAQLEAISEAIAAWRADPVVVAVREIESAHEAAMKALNKRVQDARNERRRGVGPAGTPVLQGGERQRLRALREDALAPLRADYETIKREVDELRVTRAELSHVLHKRMRDAYLLPNPAGLRSGLAQAQSSSMPLRGGVGQCCAPKLLVESTRRGLRALAMAEFWWGAASTDGKRLPGVFYGACERCEPLLGHLLCDGGLTIVYQDDHLLVVDKPAGLPSVPGRTPSKHDSVQTRVRLRFPDARAVHRLDVDTSGLLLVALDKATLSKLSKQFARREVEKRYVALLERAPKGAKGLIELCTGPDTTALLRQCVRPDGRLGRTEWRVIEGARVEFHPLEGRTHQIRLAARHGLGLPIVGDALYGRAGERLMLHAEGLVLRHPGTGERLELCSPPPF